MLSADYNRNEDYDRTKRAARETKQDAKDTYYNAKDTVKDGYYDAKDSVKDGYYDAKHSIKDSYRYRIGRPYRDAQDRLLWRDKTCPARTQLIMSWKALLLLLLLLLLLQGDQGRCEGHLQ